MNAPESRTTPRTSEPRDLCLREAAATSDRAQRAKVDLFLASALFLFLELALIRWLPAHVLFLTFFTNTILLASFLGLPWVVLQHDKAGIISRSVLSGSRLSLPLALPWSGCDFNSRTF